MLERIEFGRNVLGKVDARDDIASELSKHYDSLEQEASRPPPTSTLHDLLHEVQLVRPSTADNHQVKGIDYAVRAQKFFG